MNRANLPNEAIQEISPSPGAGWYLGRFNNVGWTKSAGQDVILTAYQINESVCRNINMKIKNEAEISLSLGAEIKALPNGWQIDVDPISII